MTIRLQHQIASGLASYAAGAGRRRQREQKYMLDLLDREQEKRLKYGALQARGVRGQAIGGGQQGLVVEGQQPGFWHNQMPGLIASGQKSQAVQINAQKRANARAARQGKPLPFPHAGEQFVPVLTKDQIERRQELEDREQKRKWQLQDEDRQRKYQEGIDAKNQLEENLDAMAASLADPPDMAPPAIRQKLAKLKSAATALSAGTHLDGQDAMAEMERIVKRYNNIMNHLPTSAFQSPKQEQRDYEENQQKLAQEQQRKEQEQKRIMDDQQAKRKMAIDIAKQRIAELEDPQNPQHPDGGVTSEKRKEIYRDTYQELEDIWPSEMPSGQPDNLTSQPPMRNDALGQIPTGFVPGASAQPEQQALGQIPVGRDNIIQPRGGAQGNATDIPIVPAGAQAPKFADALDDALGPPAPQPQQALGQIPTGIVPGATSKPAMSPQIDRPSVEKALGRSFTDAEWEQITLSGNPTQTAMSIASRPSQLTVSPSGKLVWNGVEWIPRRGS